MFLASKTEEQITNVNLLAKATGRDELQILGKELTLLQVGQRRAEAAKMYVRAEVAGVGWGRLVKNSSCAIINIVKWYAHASLSHPYQART